MILKDNKGNWYEVDDELLKGKSLVTAEEHKEKQKRVINVINNLDSDERDILYERCVFEFFRSIQQPLQRPGQIKSINKEEDLWTNLKDVNSHGTFCCVKICCVHVCCFQVCIDTD